MLYRYKRGMGQMWRRVLTATDKKYGPYRNDGKIQYFVATTMCLLFFTKST